MSVDHAAEPEQRVTALELFFDLVFVFAITQVTAFIAHDATWTRLAEGLAILIAVWWAWDAYAWLGNSAATDEGLFRVTLFAALAAMALAAIAIPDAFGANALLFGIAYAIVRVLHIASYVIVARGDPQLSHVVGVLGGWMLPAATLLIVAGVVGAGTPRAVCWIAALTIEIGGLYFFGAVEQWKVEAGHMAERFGLIIIIALGESIVALGSGAQGRAVTAGLIVAVLLGITVACAMWWAYFDVVALVAARRFQQTEGVERALMARDSYTYLHAPMVAGIILFALGVKKTLAHYGEPLDAVPAVGLCGGVALYLLAHVLFRLRNVHSLNRARLTVALVLCALIPVATHVAALTALALTAALMVSLLTYELVRYHAARERLRHAVLG
ncbi:MAG TPA: low temperature requirement protein A [Baekduia sp.]